MLQKEAVKKPNGGKGPAHRAPGREKDNINEKGRLNAKKNAPQREKK